MFHFEPRGLPRPALTCSRSEGKDGKWTFRGERIVLPPGDIGRSNSDMDGDRGPRGDSAGDGYADAQLTEVKEQIVLERVWC